MSVKIERSFLPGDRYHYDFGECSSGNGWAQVDTGQDASYYGNWINPKTLQIKTYCEGDVTLVTADTSEELVGEIRRMKSWNDEQGHKFLGIDPGLGEDLKNDCIAAGLEEFLH